ncbi:hypothetical protein [Gymnodinialimonas ulvae]|uniref:hypothetical protein n=1 Tax=Gymnodinialimonas ulvae TaxID=3126504 RepID=UPI0030B75C7A
MSLDELTHDLVALWSVKERGKDPHARVKTVLDGCTIRATTRWDHSALVMETRLPLDMIAGPEDWYADTRTYTLEGTEILVFPLRPTVVAEIDAQMAEFDALRRAAMERLRGTHPKEVAKAERYGGGIDFQGGHINDWAALIQPIWERFQERELGRFMSVFSGLTRVGTGICDVRPNVPVICYGPVTDRAEYARIFGGIQVILCPV